MLCMYVCMYICMYVIHVCILCEYVYMFIGVYVCLCACTLFLKGRAQSSKYAYMNVCTYTHAFRKTYTPAWTVRMIYTLVHGTVRMIYTHEPSTCWCMELYVWYIHTNHPHVGAWNCTYDIYTRTMHQHQTLRLRLRLRLRLSLI